MVYQRIQRLSLAEHGESRTGDLLTRVTSDIDAVQDFITSALLGIVINVLTLVGMLGVMFYMNWRFTLIGLSVAPVMFLFVYVYTKRIKKASRLVKKREGELMSGVAEKLTSIQVVQAFAREDYEDQRFDCGEPAERRRRTARAQHEGAAVADGRSAGRRRHLPRARLRRAAGPRRRLHHRPAGHLHLLSRQDLQADEGPVEDDQHRVEGDDQLRADSGAARHGEPRARPAATRSRRRASPAPWSSIASPSATTARTRSSRTSACASSPARSPRSSDRRAPARRRSPD